MPEVAANPLSVDEGTPTSAWRQADVKRAIAAAEKAGLRSYRIEIGPDGTISIVVGAPSETSANPDS
jgi:hypothetical protein